MRGWKSSITRLSPLKMEDSGFLESLRLVMRSYARVGDSGIDAIARALGLSRRTLQRRISASGLTFSKLSDQVRYELSCSLLVEQTDMGVTEIGYELGYRDPGSFTRAFRRFAGITPRHYRRLNSNTATQSAA
jgi:AraC-like DNA-binding protein